MLTIKFSDIVRATMPVQSGNEGWIGVHPRGKDYHVVVPVDVQIARGVMACNRPTDGTPFGGYTGWIYFRCCPYEIVKPDEKDIRLKQALETAAELKSFFAQKGIPARVAMNGPSHGVDFASSHRAGHLTHRFAQEASDRSGARQGPVDTRGMVYGGSPEPSSGDTSSSGTQTLLESICCTLCGKSWNGISEFLRDPACRLVGYKACPADFSLGVYVFAHHCGASIELPVVRFARPIRLRKSLIGSHACPGLCYYENSLAECSALCEGSCYRRIAGKIRSRDAE